MVAAPMKRENIVFGAKFDEERYWNAVHNASLLSDLEMLPDGDMTEVREACFCCLAFEHTQLFIY